LPATICSFIPNGTKGWWYEYLFSPNCWVYIVFYGLMIFFFSWFYASIQYDPVEIANNLKKNGGFIPGFRPGKPTADFIKKVIAKIVIFGAVYLAVVALLPIISGNIFTAFVHANFAATENAYQAVSGLAIGGTSVIIVVGVALETVKALEAQMLMRHYKGFLD
jgi:preprotein translocase subunit SecY